MSRAETFKKYQDLITECEQLIKAGKFGRVSLLISNLNLSQVPESLRLDLAKICRRAWLISQGLGLLQPIIRHENQPGDREPTASEICEYAVILSRNGNIREAQSLLEKADTSKTPEALLYMGYCHISNWEYPEAILLLEKYLKSSADDYSKLIARVNLAASYIAVSRLGDGEKLLNEIIEIATKSGATRLVGNALQLRAQVHFFNDCFTKSKTDLAKAQTIFGDTESHDQLLIKKWQTIMAAIESKSAESLIQFREEAWQRNHWESARDADFYVLKLQFDQRRLDHLYTGTPMNSYRRRIIEELKASPSQNYFLGSETGPCLDLQTGLLNGEKEIDPGKKIHQVLAVLLKDFYVPRNMGSMFSQLYPDDYFDINSSPLKVRQLLHRTRNWIKSNQIPVLIQQHQKKYWLTIQGNFGIEIQHQCQIMDPKLLSLEDMKGYFSPGIDFSAQDACQKLNWSRPTFFRWSEWALSSGHLKKSGTNRSTRYQITGSQSPVLNKAS